MTNSDYYEPDPERAAGEIIDGEAVVINLSTGVYYSLNGVAGDIWRLVTERRAVASMVAELVARYDVAAADAERDLRRVLAQLVDEGLIRRTADGADVEAPAAGHRAAYLGPEVEIYRDMQELLALDPPSPGLNGVVWKRPAKPV